MGSRTIDEGSMDEKSGMNFSEYVAILSGNTDLLEKAKLEKKIAALDSEKQAFSRSKSTSKSRLEDIVRTMDGNKEMVSRIQGDWDTFNSRVQLDKEGNKLNPIQLTGVDGSDPKVIGTKLNEIKEKARTQGQDFEIGSLYGFKIVVKTESSTSDLFDLSQNKFFVQGDSGIKYSYNNANIAADPVLASQNFLNALEKMPTLIEKYQNDTEKISKDIPVLESVLGSTWKKEDELRELKTELQTLDRKIQLSLKPIEQSEATQEQQEQETALGQPHSIDTPVTVSVVSGEPSQTNGQSPSIGQSVPHSAQPSTDDGQPSLPNNIHIVTIKPPEDTKPTAKGFKL